MLSIFLAIQLSIYLTVLSIYLPTAFILLSWYLILSIYIRMMRSYTVRGLVGSRRFWTYVIYLHCYLCVCNLYLSIYSRMMISYIIRIWLLWNNRRFWTYVIYLPCYLSILLYSLYTYSIYLAI